VNEVGAWEVRLGFVRDVLDGALAAAEDDRVYPDAELIYRALAYLRQYINERQAGA
jgi:hypothetical protein